MKDVGCSSVKKLFIEDSSKVEQKLSHKKSSDKKTLINQLENAIENQSFERLEPFLKYLQSRGVSLKSELSDQDLELLLSDIEKLKTEGIFILQKGEIEDYLPCSSIDDIIELVSEPEWLERKVEGDFRDELHNIVTAILKN